MTDPAGSDRLESGVPAGDAAGDGGALGASTEDVPLTRDEALERDARSDDDLPARADSDVARAETAGPSGEVGP